MVAKRSGYRWTRDRVLSGREVALGAGDCCSRDLWPSRSGVGRGGRSELVAEAGRLPARTTDEDRGRERGAGKGEDEVEAELEEEEEDEEGEESGR